MNQLSILWREGHIIFDPHTISHIYSEHAWVVLAVAYDHTQLAAAAAAAQHQSSVAAGSQPAAANQVAYLSGNEFIGYLNPQVWPLLQFVLVEFFLAKISLFCLEASHRGQHYALPFQPVKLFFSAFLRDRGSLCQTLIYFVRRFPNYRETNRNL